MSAALTVLEQSPVFAPVIDETRVGALGFLLGGTSALALGGVEIDPASFAGYCTQKPENRDCLWFSRNHVDLGAISHGRPGEKLADPRIRSVVAIAPEFVSVLAPENIPQIDVPLHILSLDTAFDEADWAQIAAFGTIEDATPFDVFNEF